MHPQQMCHKVREHRAHLGISHDGDADRVLFCDETGKLIDGDDVKVIEFNTRFGDPEAQILLPLIENDVVLLFEKAAKGQLASAASGAHEQEVPDVRARNQK